MFRGRFGRRAAWSPRSAAAADAGRPAGVAHDPVVAHLRKVADAENRLRRSPSARWSRSPPTVEIRRRGTVVAGGADERAPLRLGAVQATQRIVDGAALIHRLRLTSALRRRGGSDPHQRAEECRQRAGAPPEITAPQQRSRQVPPTSSSQPTVAPPRSRPMHREARLALVARTSLPQDVGTRAGRRGGRRPADLHGTPERAPSRARRQTVERRRGAPALGEAMASAARRACRKVRSRR